MSMTMEWSETNKYNSFNSFKGLSYYDNYKQIVAWLNKETDSLPPPVECNLDPIAVCNNNCYFCITQRYLRGRREEIGQMTFLPLDYMHRLIDFLADWGVRGLCISGGGEPTLLKDMHNLPSYAVQKGMDASVFTNLTIMNDNLANNLMQCRWVAMSINAGTKQTYQKITKRDFFQKVLINIEHLANLRQRCGYKVDLCYKFLILPENMNEIYQACQIAKELGVQDFHARPVDFQRWDIEGHKALEFDIAIIKEQFQRCHEQESENFHVYTVTHKFDPAFHVKHDFTRCLATPLVIPILTDGNAYLCVDRKMEEDFKVGSCYPNPEQILNWWGSDKHRDLINSVNISRCSRCTWSQYNAQIEQTVLSDKMCLSFP